MRQMTDFERKFPEFIKACESLQPNDVFMIAMPEALGDTYEEIIESLNRLSDTEAHLVIVPRKQRHPPAESQS